MLDFTSQCWISPRSSGSRPARPVGSARAVPAPPSARGAHQMARHALPRDLLARHALYPRRPRRVALTRWLGTRCTRAARPRRVALTRWLGTHSRATCWLGTRCTRAALGAWRLPDGSARAVPAPPALGAWRSPDGSARTPARPVGSARAVPAPPSARGARQMARHAFPRDLLTERTEVPFGRYGIGRRRAVFRTCRPCFRIIILALKDFAFHCSEVKSHVQPRKNPLTCRL